MADRKRRIEVTLELPSDLADELERVLDLEPEFLDRIVLQAIIRRGIYRGIRDRVEDLDRARRILAENRYHDGGAWADRTGVRRDA
jgi:hypothetical protein